MWIIFTEPQATICNNNELHIQLQSGAPVENAFFFNGLYFQRWPDSLGIRRWVNPGFPGGYSMLLFNQTSNHWELSHFTQTNTLTEQLQFIDSGSQLPPNTPLSMWEVTTSVVLDYIGQPLTLDFGKTTCDCVFGTNNSYQAHKTRHHE